MSADDEVLLQNVSREKVLVVLNKTDLPQAVEAEDILAQGFKHVLQISALHKTGIEELKDEIEGMFVSGSISPQSTFISNQRHYQALLTALDLLRRVASDWDTLPLDLLALDLRHAWQVLGEITGSAWSEDLLNDIFQRFCLGK